MSATNIELTGEHVSWFDNYLSSYKTIEGRHKIAELVPTESPIPSAFHEGSEPVELTATTTHHSRPFLLAHWAEGDDRLKEIAYFIYNLGDDVKKLEGQPIIVVDKDTKGDLFSDEDFFEGDVDLRVGKLGGYLLHPRRKKSMAPRNAATKRTSSKMFRFNKALEGGFFTLYDLGVALKPGTACAFTADIVSCEMKPEPHVRTDKTHYEPGVLVYEGRLPWPATPHIGVYDVLKKETVRQYFIGSAVCVPMFERLRKKLTGDAAEEISEALGAAA